MVFIAQMVHKLYNCILYKYKLTSKMYLNSDDWNHCDWNKREHINKHNTV